MEKNKTVDKPMEKSPTRLGRGLSALIPPQAARPAPAETSAPPVPAADGVQELALSVIVANPSQPRSVFAPGALDDLTASIRAHGVLQPVMVRPRGGGRYELVAGERRYRAAQEAGLTRIPAVIRSLTDAESLTVALIENIQREDLNPIEAARGYRRLMDDYGLTQTQLGEQINKQQSTISNAMRLLNLPLEMQESLSRGDMTTEHGKTLLSVEDAVKRRDIWEKIITLRLSVKETQGLAAQANGTAVAKKSHKEAPPPAVVKDLHWQDIENQFRRALGVKVEVTPKPKGASTLLISFDSAEQLEEILERVR